MWESSPLRVKLHSQKGNHFCEPSLNSGRNQPGISHVGERGKEEKKNKKKEQTMTAVLESNTEEDHIKILFNYYFIYLV